jgi:hypothetical protein
VLEEVRHAVDGRVFVARSSLDKQAGGEGIRIGILLGDDV